MQVCNKCFIGTDIIKPGKRCKNCVNEYKNKWANQRKNRRCVLCKSSFITNGISKECSLKCKILNRVKKIEECWEWQGKISKSGYGCLYSNGKHDTAHRVSYRVFKGEIDQGKQVCHKCDNRKCCNPDHLWTGTQKENINDAVNKNRMVSGERNHASKLTSESVGKIKKLLESGAFMRDLSEEFGVSIAAISYIKTGKNWKEDGVSR